MSVPQENIYPSAVFLFSTSSDLRSTQKLAVQKLEDLFTYDRIMKHSFEWEAKHMDWLPRFEAFWRPKDRDLTIDEIWREDRFGIDGNFLSKSLLLDGGLGGSVMHHA